MAISLSSITLAMPSEYTRTFELRGSMRKMANGVVVEDTLDSTPKREWTLSWKVLNDSQAQFIELAWQLLTGGSGTYVDLDGTSFTVTKHPSQLMLEWKAVKTSSGIRWDGQMKLREV